MERIVFMGTESRIRIASTKIDRHNMRVTKEALQDMAEQIQEAPVRMLVDHDSTLPPLGRVTNAEIVESKSLSEKGAGW